MRTIVNKVLPFLVTALALSVTGAIAQETDERQRLVERKNVVQARIDTLKREQDYLLFRKQMYASDSKYLLLDLPAGKGELKYRDRTLKDITFLPVRAASRRLPPGTLALTAKKEKEGKKRTLIFGTALIIETKQKTAVGRKRNAPLRLALPRKDMASIFYALDTGSLVYIIR